MKKNEFGSSEVVLFYPMFFKCYVWCVNLKINCVCVCHLCWDYVCEL